MANCHEPVETLIDTQSRLRQSISDDTGIPTDHIHVVLRANSKAGIMLLGCLVYRLPFLRVEFSKDTTYDELLTKLTNEVGTQKILGTVPLDPSNPENKNIKQPINPYIPEPRPKPWPPTQVFSTELGTYI